jgi:hypothetical protein
MASMSAKRVVAAMFLVASIPVTSMAQADEPSDVVMLANGGRMRGTVVEHDPSKSTTIRLLDGTTRKLKASEVARIQYGEAAVPAAALPVAAPLPPPAPPPVVLAPVSFAAPAATPRRAADSDDASAVETRMKSKPLFVTGIILMGVGAVAAVAGGAYYAAHSGTQTAGYQSCGDLGCTNSHENYQDSTDTTIGEGLAVGGGIAVATGLVFMLIGKHRVPVKRPVDAWTFTPTVGRKSAGLTVTF